MASTTTMPPPLRARASNRYMRVVVNHLATVAAVGSTILVMAPLIAIFAYLLFKGASSLNLAFFTQIPKPVGEVGGGMANALIGTLMLIALGSVIGVFGGVLPVVSLSEDGAGRLGAIVRFGTDMLSSVPSIVIGMFVYALLVQPM